MNREIKFRAKRISNGEWLEREMNNYISFDGEIDKEFIADFKKAMEE